MKLGRVAQAVTGRKLDGPEERPRFGAWLHRAGVAATYEEVGVTFDTAPAKPQDWAAVQRAWAREPAPTIEERLAALESQSK